METIYLVVSIDTECDKGPEWKTQFPLRFTSVAHGLSEVLLPLFRQHEIKPTLLLSPEVLRDEASALLLRRLDHCELGTHLHAEFIEPQANWDAPVTRRPQSGCAPEIELEKLQNLTALFQTQIGRQPLSFRAGRFALGAQTLPFLERLGYQVDSSVTPFRTHSYGDGVRSNYWGAPLHAYHPSARDPRRPGRLRLLEVPVSILVPSLARWPRWILRRLDDRFLRQKRLLRLLGVDGTKFWVRPWRGTAEELVGWAETVIATWRGPKPAILNVMFHSVEVIPGASPYAQNPQEVERLLDSLSALFRHLAERYRVQSVSLSDLHAELAGG